MLEDPPHSLQLLLNNTRKSSRGAAGQFTAALSIACCLLVYILRSWKLRCVVFTPHLWENKSGKTNSLSVLSLSGSPSAESITTLDVSAPLCAAGPQILTCMLTTNDNEREICWDRKDVLAKSWPIVNLVSYFSWISFKINN